MHWRTKSFHMVYIILIPSRAKVSGKNFSSWFRKGISPERQGYAVVYTVLCVCSLRVYLGPISFWNLLYPWQPIYEQTQCEKMEEVNTILWFDFLYYYMLTFLSFSFVDAVFFIYSDSVVKLTLTHWKIRASIVASKNKMRCFYAIRVKSFLKFTFLLFHWEEI